MHRLAPALLLLLLTTATARAEELHLCSPGTTLAACLGLAPLAPGIASGSTPAMIFASPAGAPAIVPANVTAFTQEQVDRLIDAVLALREGGLSSTAGQDTPGYKDFLSQFGASTGLFTTSEDETSLNLSWNIKSLEGKLLQPQLESKFLTAPTVFESLSEKLPEAGRADVIKRLEKGLDGRDDVTHTLHIKLNRPKKSVGEDGPGSRSALVASLTAGAAPVGWSAVAQRFSTDLLGGKAAPLNEVDAVFATAIRNLVMAALSTNEASTAAAKESQFYLSLAFRDRSELTGPDVLTAKLTFEWSPFEKHDGRLTFSGSYVETRPYSSSVEDVSLQLPADQEGVFQLTFNRSFPQPIIGSLGWKLEGSAKGETFSSQKDRLVAALTLIQPLATGTSLSAGLVWANRQEFLPEDTDRVSARVGLRFSRLGSK